MGLLSLPSSDGGRLCSWNAPELGLDALLGFDNFFTLLLLLQCAKCCPRGEKGTEMNNSLDPSQSNCTTFKIKWRILIFNRGMF